MNSYVTLATDILLNLYNYCDFEYVFNGNVEQLLFLVKYLNNLNINITGDPIVKGRFYYNFENETIFITRKYDKTMKEFLLMEDF